MDNIIAFEIPTNAIVALFPTSARSFGLAKGATFADLAESIDWISNNDTHVPTAIYLTIGVKG